MRISKCQQKKTETKIKIEERGKKVIFLNPARAQFIVTHVDGCLVKGVIAADRIVTKADIGDVVIELKGGDVEHGAKQVTATTDFWIRSQNVKKKLAGLIVCTQYPRADTRMQKLQQAFVRKFGAPLHVICGARELELEKVLSFNGPYKE